MIQVTVPNVVFQRNLKNEGARAKKLLFFTLFHNYGQNLRFFGPSTFIFEISLKLKNWNSNLDHLQQLLLKSFCSQMTF